MGEHVQETYEFEHKKLGKIVVNGVEYKTTVQLIAELQAKVDELQAQLDRSMPLPLDADGVLIRFGDYVHEVDDNVAMEVRSFTYYPDCVDVNACGMNPKLLLHVKPRTVEDVLAEIANNAATNVDGKEHCWKPSDFKAEADDIRELLRMVGE